MSEKDNDHWTVANECMSTIRDNEQLACMLILKTEKDKDGIIVRGFTIHENIITNSQNKTMLKDMLENVIEHISSDDYPDITEKNITL